MTFLIILAAIALFLFWVSKRPGDFTIERQIEIKAPAATIFPWVSNLKNMNQWNPWAGQDAKSAIAYEGPEAGPGAIYTWSGGKMGKGRFQILDMKAPGEVNCRLQMIRPMAADNKVKYILTESGGNTTVSWAMSGTSSFVVKLMHLVFSPERMVGKEFERGLASLKQLVEQQKLK